MICQLMYSKTNRFFEFNKKRREQGRVPIPCVWPECTGHAMAREIPPSKNRNYTSYRVEAGHLAGIVRYPICELHREIIYAAFGERAKLNGIKAIINGQNEEESSRVGGPLARLVIFNKTKGCCAHCNTAMKFTERWHADHRVPLFKGGLTKFSNMQPLCVSCHREKSREEKREANLLRYGDQRSWASRHQLAQTVCALRSEVARLKSILAHYICEEEGAG